MSERAYEVNFDGLVGPTHNYAGLAMGNVASQRHGGSVSNPKAAALQGLAKMKLLADLGVKQAVLPPQLRPSVAMLRRMGCTGSDAEVITQAARQSPQALAAACSASSMWAANAATVSPSADTADGRAHFTPANLVSHAHRSIEPPATAAVLKAIFNDDSHFVHHDPLPGAGSGAMQLSDEGAANHTRLCRSHGGRGIEVFVYGRDASAPTTLAPLKYPARQSRQASEAIARLHGLDPARTVLICQNPAAIDAGVFHNDVIAVGNEHVLLVHRDAYVQPRTALDEVRRKFDNTCGGALVMIEVTADELPLADAVDTYLFNSQLVTLPDGSMALVCPVECQRHPGAKAVVDAVIAEASNPIGSAHFVDTRQSMRNGGGPACLRLRVVLTEAELAAVHPGVLFSDALHDELMVWVERHYRDELRPDDLADPSLLNESRAALNDLANILRLPCAAGQ